MALLTNAERERGASLIETAISIVLVALIVITATNSFGGGLRNSINSLTYALNPSASTELDLAFSSGSKEDAPLVEIIAGKADASRAGGVARRPPANSEKPSGQLGFALW